jgi:predicted RNase H-like nuclease (RuvC/YqgF family)
MSEAVMTLIAVVLGGGLIAALVSVYKARSERQKMDAETEAVGAKTPAEVESIQITSMVNALNGARAINDDLRKDNEALRREFDILKERFDTSEEHRAEDSKTLHKELDGMRRALRAAQEYIEAWIAWGQRVAPNEPQPEAPPDYRRI